MKTRGFTLIELMIVIAIMAILAAIIIPAAMGIHGTASSSGVPNSASWGWNGVVETRCIEGYKVLISNAGRYGTGMTQMLDQNGHAIPCGRN